MNIKLDLFEGPLDLLLHLIEKAEVDIYEIPIADITKQYLDILQEATELELEITSEFLIMAATLISIKSRMLLPPIAKKAEQQFDEEQWVDPRQELVEKLLEYKQYRVVSNVLQEKEEKRSLIYSRLPMDLTHLPINVNLNQELTPDILLRALVLLFKSKKTPEPIRKIEREEVSISQCIKEICRQLQEGNLYFSQLSSNGSKEKVITTFLALLELMKQQRVLCKQYMLFEDIQIMYIPNG